MGESRTSKYYAANPEARKKRVAKQAEINRRPEEKARRAELQRERRQRGIDGAGGPDVSHTKGGGTTLEDSSRNRARNGAQKGKSPRAKRTNTKK